MENKKNEIVEIENNEVQTFKNNTYSGEDMVNMMSSALSAVERMAEQIAQNNAEKYKAQSNVLIAEIEKERQNESEEINGYYNIRMKQEDKVGNIIEAHQNRINKLWDEAIEAESDEKRKSCIDMFEVERKDLNNLLEKQMEVINNTQNKRIEKSKSRNKGLFGFLKKL